MFGASGKVGRGGGGSGGKRNVHAQPISRAATTGRLSMGGGPRGRAAAVTSSPSTSSLQAEESFSLVRENPLNFAMAIKLAPDLVEEIKRVEAEGGTARIKFDANANNTNGNVIRVGDKHFKFTWSREPGDLCDIYEERRSGEDGSGLLVESGGTWRKLNVERELDESTKNHVKMRSEEAERKHKSRKAIILDHQNPNMKNQMKALTAAESTPWRNFKHKKEPPFKKPKSEPPSAGGPPKSAYKSSLSTTTLSKGKFSSGSPLSSQPEHRGASASPIGSGNIVKGHTSVPDVAPTKSTNKASSSDKEMHGRLPGNTVSDKSKHNRNTEVKPADLRSLMVSLLLEHQPKGMSKQALEKAVGDAMPNSARQIEPILKQIAIFKAPGRYLLKPGVEMESFKEPPSQSGSSPEINRHQSPASLKLDRLPPQDPSFSMRTAANDEEQDPLNSKLGHTTDTIEKIDILNDSPENSSDKKVPENIERIAGSSDSGSDSDSDSDSDSSDSDSDSGGHSKSKSRSPEGSRSSSESESDASSSSKQASDEEVDIMSDNDDIESNHKSPDSDPVPLKSPVQWRHQDKESVDIGNNEKHDDHVSDIVDIEKDSPENFEADRDAVNIFPDKEGEEPVQEINRSSNHRENQERQVSERKPYSGPESVVNDGFKHGQSGSHERMKEKSKRCSDDKHSDERSHNRKKLKSKKLSQPVIGTINSIFGESPDNSSPARPIQGPDDGAINLMADRTCRGDTNDPNLQLGNQAIPTGAISDSQQPGPRSFQGIGRGDAPSGEKRPGEYDSLGRVDKYSEKNLQTNVKEFNKDAQSENGLVSERRPIKSSAEGVGIKHATMTDSHNRKSEMQGKLKDNNPSTTGRLPVMNGRGRVLQRELSDLEVGEFREPFNDDTPAPKKQFERRSSFKQLENKRTDSEYWNTDLSREKLFNKITADLGKISPPNSEAVESIPDGPSKKKVPEHDVDDLTRPHQKTTRPLHQHSLQRSGDHIEVGQHNRVPEMSGKGRSAEAGTGSGANLEAYGDTSRKVHVNSTEHQHDTIRGVEKESKKQKPNVVGDSNGRRKDASLTGSNDGSQKRRESSSDENSCSYTKYEKEEPELKGPIKDASQYKEYVKEYQEKYESYCSLNKILESYRDEFSKLGKDLESYKDRDMKRYNDILGQMRSSFRQCGERHTRLKKIFVVLYEELKHLKQMIKDYAASYKKD